MIEPGPSFSVSDVARGWVRGLQSMGVEVATFNYSDRLNFYTAVHVKHPGSTEFVKPFTTEEGVQLAAKGISATAFEWWPDLVIICSGFYVPDWVYDVLRARRMKTVLLCTESPYEDDTQLERAAKVDWVVLNDPTNMPRFRAVNPNVCYVPHAYDPTIHHPRPPDAEMMSDFCFVGTGYPSRVEFLEQVDWTGIDVALAGNWQWAEEGSILRKFLAHDIEQCLPNEDTARMYASTKASANIYRREAQRDELIAGWAMGPREVELAAIGTFYLREARGENEVILPMLPAFDGPGDFGEKLRWWLAHDEARHEATIAAHLAVADRTFPANAERLLHLIYG